MKPKRLRAGARNRALFALTVVCLAVAGCSIINALVTTRSSLSNAGWNVVSTNIQSGSGHGADGTLLVSVDYRSSLNEDAAQQANQVARIVWDNTPGRFSFLRVGIDNASGVGPRPRSLYSRALLVTMFGPRPGTLDASALINVSGLTHDIFVSGVAALVVIILIAAAVILLVNRSAKRKAARRAESQAFAMYPPGGYWPGGQEGWPPNPYQGYAPAQGYPPPPGYAPDRAVQDEAPAVEHPDGRADRAE
jgi:hypothetical protein